MDQNKPALGAGSTKAPIWRPLRLALFTILFGVGGVFGWGAFAMIDSAVVAPGTLMVELNRRNVQHLEGGIVGDVLVREGAIVAAGQPLIRLDDTRVRAGLNVVQDETDRTRARIAVLIAEREDAPAPNFPPELMARRAEAKIAEILAVQNEEFIARRISLQGQTEILTQRAMQLQKQIDGLNVRIESNDRQLALVRQEIIGVEGLVRMGLERLPRLLSLQREEARLIGERGEAIENVARTQQAVGEAEMQRAQLLRSRQEDNAKELRELQGKLLELREREISANDQLMRLSIDAPEAGMVMDLRFSTRGGVIAPGSQVASIVPQEERLVVEAQITPIDVDTVRAGMPASIRLSHAAARTTPVLEGMVERISPDRMTDQRTGMPYFVARISFAADELTRYEHLRLQPGMHAEVLIRRGERSFASYLARPLADRFAKSIREF
ncbi:MAG: HlyD family type I secretion periplasmic adaptor subunit [Roseomonas sp.]|nr:HlyD family type I secretion periplasmic adaptor subunit [Roseomonas sp.]MCA3328303.1 HlyD family type I secretion periplasmic adaptor subunit [Roseomonas sp.]MCA3331493.1 HlyD family type I secretion periplasmic adaptor subunit [Roseomonas sp.]MCA3335572.1 HlyD family type I secretion periplasmic adaptor subunit [Roseomonas sp.]MCA3347466.1 HlyD family type I secretion periplasmic adaptor subunit [Roseomonas sp.]